MADDVGQGIDIPEDAVEAVFGASADRARTYVEMMAEHGVRRGLIGPREVDRLWDRHVLNSGLIAELIPSGSSVIDVGSGAGLPGVPLALAREDLDIVLLEPMARRVTWLEEVLRRLAIQAKVMRGRAEERAVRQELGGADIVTARALAPLSRLCQWCLPLVRPGGTVLAMKGASAEDELVRDREAVRAAGGVDVALSTHGAELGVTPTTVVAVTRAAAPASNQQRSHRRGRSRK